MREYTFPTKVISPEASQEESYKSLLPPLMEKFLKPPLSDDSKVNNAYNILLFAYGQTGTGKTHSIFGPKTSLSQTENQSDWGIFPVTVSKILDYMATVKHEGIECILTVGALDFYVGTCVDLMNNRELVEVDEKRTPLGYKELQLSFLEELLSFLETILKARKSFGTRMNEASQEDDHDGSSRSHCALILTLRQVNKENRQCLVNRFTVVDLAGAERPSTTGGERMSAFEAYMALSRGEECTGSTGILINFELHQLGHEVVKATEQHKKGKKYNAPTQLCMPAVQFLGTCFDGSSLLGILVCLSQAKHCGWETWFSLQYGETLSKLRCPVKPRTSHPIDSLLKRESALIEKAREALVNARTDSKKAKKWNTRRRGILRYHEYQHRWLNELKDLL